MRLIGDGRYEGGSERVFLLQAAQATPQQQALELGLDWAARSRAPTALLALHLSHLHAPGPRPHHRRIASNLLEHAVQAHGGQMFACPNGDLLLVTEPDAAARMLAVLVQLFRAEQPGADRLLALWSLPAEEAIARAQLAIAPNLEPLPEEAPVPLGAVAAVEAVLAAIPAEHLVQRQTAVRITRLGLEPIFQELSISLAALQSRVGGVVPLMADPFLFRHLAARLDIPLLEACSAARLPLGPVIHLNMTLPGILSPGFERLATALPPGTLGVEILLMEAAADPARFAAIRTHLRDLGCRLVLDGLDHAVLSLLRPAAWEPDLVKLDWSPRMAELPGRERRTLVHAIEAIGPERIVLQRAETEAALAWGRAHGVCRFQGRHVDAMLAAARLSACTHAAGCTLRQCIGRAAAASPAGRSGCHNLPLLDAEAGGASAQTAALA